MVPPSSAVKPVIQRQNRRALLRAGVVLLAGRLWWPGVAATFSTPVLARAELDTLKPLSLPSPSVQFDNDAGNKLQLADYRGTPLVVNFWASWCAPCIHELPDLVQLHRRLEAVGMAVLLISVDRGGAEKAADFLDAQGVPSAAEGPLRGYDPSGKLARAFGLRGLPSSVLINRHGQPLYMVEGPAAWASDPVAAEIIRLLQDS